MVKLAGHLLCQTCDHLFGRFFAPSRRTDGDRMKEAFEAWDENGNGVIEKDELRRVLKALKPDFPERDLCKLMIILDTNGNGVIELQEFCDWIMQGSPMEVGEDSFEDFVGSLMREAGAAMISAQMDIVEVQVQPTGTYFMMQNGEMRMETSAFCTDGVELAHLDPEEFICKVECTEAGLLLTMNTGRVAVIKGSGEPFGPWSAPEGFKVAGLRTKPLLDAAADGVEVPEQDRVCGMDLVPLMAAKEYDSGQALRFAAEREYMHTLQKMLAKAAIDVNSFSPAGVTALMLAAQHGNVGASRLLLGSKANPALTDEDGWTALTFASRYGHTSMVDVLVQRGGSEVDDSGAALREALRHRHNSSARALLRAGFGPAPRGAFALEQLPDESSFTLPSPTVRPEVGAYSKPVIVELLPGDFAKPKQEEPAPEEEAEAKDEAEAAPAAEAEEAPPAEGQAAEASAEEPAEGEKEEANPQEAEPEAKAEEPPATAPAAEAPLSATAKAIGEVAASIKAASVNDVQLFYTLDGRDPSVTGKRYRGPLTLSGARNHLRIVAIQGNERSVVVDAVYIVCHYAIPDEIVTGTLRIRTFPEVQEALAHSIATVLGEPQERVGVKATDVEGGSNVWLRIPVCDPNPRHSIAFDRSYATVRSKPQPFIDKFRKDVEKALGKAPVNCELKALRSGGQSDHKAGSIAIDFTLPRDLALQVATQLKDSTSYLLSEAKMRTLFAEAEVTVVEPLGERLTSKELQQNLHEALGKRATVDEVVGIGSGEAGVIAISLTAKEAKKIKEAHFVTKCIKEFFPDAALGELQEGVEELDWEYTVDVQSRVGDTGDRKDGGTVVQELNGGSMTSKLEQKLLEKDLALNVLVKDKASSRGLSELEFHLEWEHPVNLDPTQVLVKDYLDGICMIYSGEELSEVVDFRSAIEQQLVYDGARTPEAASLARSIGRAIRHSGDMMSDKGGEHRMWADLDALPLSVTDLFFVLASFASGDLSLFGNPLVQIHDAVLGRQLTQYNLGEAGDAQAVVMCSLSRDPDHGIWVVHGLGIPTQGNAKNYGGIRETLTKLQGGYSRWGRRKDIVLLRSLHEHARVSENSKSEFADTLNSVLGLPIPIFQLLLTWL